MEVERESERDELGPWGLAIACDGLQVGCPEALLSLHVRAAKAIGEQ